MFKTHKFECGERAAGSLGQHKQVRNEEVDDMYMNETSVTTIYWQISKFSFPEYQRKSNGDMSQNPQGNESFFNVMTMQI